MGNVINLEALTRPFTSEQVKQRQGRGGITLDYLEAHTVITRLNEAFEGCWSFEVLEHRVLDDEVVVHGQLTAGGIVKGQFGGSEISRLRDSGKPVSISDDLKAAASDCIKKCASLFGVGLELYQKGDRRGIERPTDEQLDRIDELAKHFAISDEDKKTIADSIAKMTRAEAKQLIEFLEIKIKAVEDTEKGKKGTGKARRAKADGKEAEGQKPDPTKGAPAAANGNGQTSQDAEDEDDSPPASEKQIALIEKTVKANTDVLTDKEVQHIKGLLNAKLSRKKASEVLDFLLGQSSKNPLTGEWERVSQGVIDQRRQARKKAA